MPRKPTRETRTENDRDLLHIAFAIHHLRSAYDYLRQTHASRAAHDTRRALESAEAARRDAKHRRLTPDDADTPCAKIAIEDCRFTLTPKGFEALKDAAKP